MPKWGIDDFTPDSLRSNAKLLSRYSDELQRIADDMAAARIEGVTIKGVGELERSKTGLSKFCGYAQLAVHTAVFRRETHGDESDEQDLPARPRTAKKKAGRPSKKKPKK